MAEQKKNDDLDAFAFEIFKQTVAQSKASRGGEQQARAAYVKAEAFLAVRDKVRSGELTPSKPVGVTLCDCRAPNLGRTHPHNLVSQVSGNLEKVNRIAAWLDKNPTADGEPDELVANLNRTFPDLGWGLPEINTARAVFPAYTAN